MSKVLSLFALFVFLFCTLLVQAQDKPNFSGEWKLDPDKSDFGPAPIPEKYIRKVKHEDPKLSFTQVQTGPEGEQQTDVTCTTDGKECENNVRGIETKSTATWEGKDLLMNTNIEVQGMKIGMKDKWTLSEDGKMLVETLHLVTPQGEFDMKLVLNKQ